MTHQFAIGDLIVFRRLNFARCVIASISVDGVILLECEPREGDTEPCLDTITVPELTDKIVHAAAIHVPKTQSVSDEALARGNMLEPSLTPSEAWVLHVGSRAGIVESPRRKPRSTNDDLIQEEQLPSATVQDAVAAVPFPGSLHCRRGPRRPGTRGQKESQLLTDRVDVEISSRAVDDVMETLRGRIIRRTLTVAGVTHKNEVFFHPERVTRLLEDLLPAGVKTARSATRSSCVLVEWVEHDDISWIKVLNPVREEEVFIPNANPQHKGSYEDAVEERRKQQEATSEFVLRNIHPLSHAPIARKTKVRTLIPRRRDDFSDDAKSE